MHPLPFDPIYKDISSTAIRRAGDIAAPDVPQEVRRFMRETRAYLPPVRRADGTYYDAYAARIAMLSRYLHGPVS